MAKVKGFGERVRDQLRLLGYWKNGKPDINRFSVEHGYIPSYVYRWAKGEVPRGVALLRLSRDLQASPERLLGVEAPKRRHAAPIAGGSVNGGTTPLAPFADVLPLIRNWWQQWASALQPQWSTA